MSRLDIGSVNNITDGAKRAGVIQLLDLGGTGTFQSCLREIYVGGDLFNQVDILDVTGVAQGGFFEISIQLI